MIKICILFLLLASGLTAYAPVAPIAIAKFCGDIGGRVVAKKQKKFYVEQLTAEGCQLENIVVTDLGEGYSHIYGIKLIIGE